MSQHTSFVRLAGKHVRNLSVTGLALMLGACGSVSEMGRTNKAQKLPEGYVDCPLRHDAYSVDTPLMDMLVSEQAVALLEAEAPELMKRMPPLFKATEAPSLSAITTIKQVAGLVRLPMTDAEFAALDEKLAQIEITEAIKESRCARYDVEPQDVVIGKESRQILIFDKVNGFDHGEAVTAATEAIQAMAADAGWGVVVSNKGSIFTPELLENFDVVVWNNVSGDVLTLRQRQAFEDYMNNGGGFVGVHGSGGDFIYLWDWYLNELLGAQFIGHTMFPHYQDAVINLEVSDNNISEGLNASWTLHEEWYSFAENPRTTGASVVATVDENTYKPIMGGLSLAMGDDHPIAWTRCVGEGRSYYTGIGHLPESYQSADNLELLKSALVWAMGDGADSCN